MINDKTRNKGTNRAGTKNKFSKYSAEVLDSLNFDVIDALLSHYEDMARRIKAEESRAASPTHHNVKVRKSYLHLLAQEQAYTMKALLPYANIKPSKLIDKEEQEVKPIAVKLNLPKKSEEDDK